MTPNEALKEIMVEKRITQTRLAELAGYSGSSAIRNRLNSKISADLLISLLSEMDYEIVVQPKTQGKRKEGSIVLEPSGLPDGRGKRKSAVEANAEVSADG